MYPLRFKVYWSDHVLVVVDSVTRLVLGCFNLYKIPIPAYNTPAKVIDYAASSARSQ